MIANLIKPRMGKLIFNHLIGYYCPELRNRLLGSYFFKLTLGSDCLGLFGIVCSWQPLWNHHGSEILQEYQSLSNQSVKHNSAHMPSSNFTPKLSFETRFRMFISNGYCTKNKRLQFLVSLLKHFLKLHYRWYKDLPFSGIYCEAHNMLFEAHKLFLPHYPNQHPFVS